MRDLAPQTPLANSESTWESRSSFTKASNILNILRPANAEGIRGNACRLHVCAKNRQHTVLHPRMHLHESCTHPDQIMQGTYPGKRHKARLDQSVCQQFRNPFGIGTVPILATTLLHIAGIEDP